VPATGIKSLARELVLGYEDKPKSSGYACYRAYFKGAFLKEDPLCREFVEKECVNIWIGHDVHMVQNTLRDGEEFNWILTHKDVEDIKESWFQPGDMDDVRRIVEDVDPRIKAAVCKTKECLDWKICYRDPIPSWVSKHHKIALLGDSCHPHLPTSAQGASQATESGAVLAMCLKLAGKDNVPLAVSFSPRNEEALHRQHVILTYLADTRLRETAIRPSPCISKERRRSTRQMA
jgi:salicylate hydroxylase